jgi:hypothetical protein
MYKVATYEVWMERTCTAESVHATRAKAEAAAARLRTEFPDETFHVFGFMRAR